MTQHEVLKIEYNTGLNRGLIIGMGMGVAGLALGVIFSQCALQKNEEQSARDYLGKTEVLSGLTGRKLVASFEKASDGRAVIMIQPLPQDTLDPVLFPPPTRPGGR